MEQLQKNTLVNKLDKNGNIIKAKNNNTIKTKKDLSKISKSFTTIAKFYKHLRYLETKIEKELENYQYSEDTDNENEIENNSLLFQSNNEIEKQNDEEEKKNEQQISNEIKISVQPSKKKINKLKINKEIEDIINTNYSKNKFKKRIDSQMYLNKFKGYKNELNLSKKKGRRKSTDNFGNIQIMQNIENTNNKENLDKDKINRERILQKRIQNFFNKIQYLKNCENVGEEIEQLINDNMGQNEYLNDKDIENRKRKFFNNFECTRTFYKNSQNYYRNKLIFSSPALFKTCNFNL